MGVNQIVDVQVSQQVAPFPNFLQQNGALISQGGTSLAVDGTALLTQYSDLTALLLPSHAVTSMAWAGGTVTVTTPAHGFTVGATVPIVIAGAVPAAYNGLQQCTITSSTQFTFPLASNPGAETTPGTYQANASIELQTMAATFFGQGFNRYVTVLELGQSATNTAASIAVLSTWLSNNPSIFYSFLVPRNWSAEASFKTLIASFENDNAQTYFWATVKLADYATYTDVMKDVFRLVEAPSVVSDVAATGGTEFSLAAAFFWSLAYRPSNTNRVGPFAFKFMFGVTPYPTPGNGPLLVAFKNSNTNYIGTGAEGGISFNTIYPGVTSDGRDFTYWYSVDWVAINTDLNVSNAVINGSNTPQNPLYLNQDGINRLQAVAAQTMQTGVSNGLVNGHVIQTELDGQDLDDAINSGQFAGKCVVNAVPFITYYTNHPGDYRIGEYDGLSCIYVPSRGFIHLIYNVVVTDFITQ